MAREGTRPDLWARATSQWTNCLASTWLICFSRWRPLADAGTPSSTTIVGSPPLVCCCSGSPSLPSLVELDTLSCRSCVALRARLVLSCSCSSPSTSCSSSSSSSAVSDETASGAVMTTVMWYCAGWFLTQSPLHPQRAQAAQKNEPKQSGAKSHRKCSQNTERQRLPRAFIQPTQANLRTYRFASDGRVQEICSGSTKVSCTVQRRHSTPDNPISPCGTDQISFLVRDG
ncbi:hypothetical protein KC329_g94 [Hortaea werneckii]|nr:hypothetical protein KC329_g94 [Hortaea werneckii]